MRMTRLALVALLTFVLASPAGASLLTDWFGVSLSVSPSGYFMNSWAPTPATADYRTDDNWSAYFGRQPYGGEQFDIEAIYFDNTDTEAYVAIVTSFPGPPGLDYGIEFVRSGDLAIDLGGGTYDVGVDIDDMTGQVADTDVGDWYQSSSLFVAEYGKTNFAGGLPLGTALVSAYDAGLPDERGYGTYVYEVTIGLDALGNPGDGDAIGLQWTMGCRNDVIQLDADFDGEPVIPEPGTLLLLGSGLLGMVGLARRRRK